MYQVSAALRAALDSQRLYLRVTSGQTVLDGERITGLTYSASVGGGEDITIGGVTAATVTLTVAGRVNLLNLEITVEVGTPLSGTMAYVPLGAFIVTESQDGEDSTTLTAYDAAYWALGGDYVPTVVSGATVAAVLGDIATQTGLTLAALPASASATAVTGDLSGRTFREMVGYLAALLGRSAVIDRDGTLRLVWFSASGVTVTPDDYYAGGLVLGGSRTLACIACSVETEGADGEVETTLLTAGGTGLGPQIENPYMTQAILDDIWTEIGGLAYETGSCGMINGLLLEPGDLITVTDRSGGNHVIPVMALTLTIDGGCRAEVSATGQSDSAMEANFSGPLGSTVSQLKADVVKANNLAVGSGKVATNYLTFDEDTGLDVGYAGTDAKARITGDGMEVFDGNGNSAAFFGVENNMPTSRVGYQNSGHSVIDSGGMEIYGGDGTTQIANLGYGPGASSSGSTLNAPYYTLGTRASGPVVGNYSMVEGYNNTASGYASHCEGRGNTASGHYSHAGGRGTIAAGVSQTAIGEYNKEDTSNEYAFIVGSGSGANNRRNALAVDWHENLIIGGVLIQVPDYDVVTYSSGWHTYGVNQTIALYRAGNVISFHGAFSYDGAAFTSSTAETVVCTIPERFRPTGDVVVLCQGSGTNTWMLRVYANGNVCMSRYRNAAGVYQQVAEGTWFPFSATWINYSTIRPPTG